MAETLISRTLKITYGTEQDTKVTHSMETMEHLEAETVSNVMDTVIGKNVFTDAEGNALHVAESALIRTITEQQLFG